MPDYKPVSCQVHSQLELHIMHRQTLRLQWREPTGVSYNLTITPVDIYTRDGQEFLRIVDEQGREKILRLDWIDDFSPVE